MMENIQKIQVKETEDLGLWTIEDQPIEQFISKLQSYIDRGYTTISCEIWGYSPSKIQKMENRIQELEEQLESTSYNLGELEAQVNKTGVYMEDW